MQHKGGQLGGQMSDEGRGASEGEVKEYEDECKGGGDGRERRI